MRNNVKLDRMVLAEMVKAGSDMTKPHPISYFLYFNSKSAALSAGDILAKEGYKVAVNLTSYPFWKRLFMKYTWLCLADITYIPEDAKVIATSQRMCDLCDKFHGDFDGWEAEIIR